MDNTQEAKRQTYWRLLRYVKPYWGRMTVGIIAGFIVGGSLFGSLMLIPSLMSGVDFTSRATRTEEKLTAERIVASVQTAGSEEQKLEAVRKLIDKPRQEETSKIKKEIGKANKTLRAVGLSSLQLRYDKGDVQLMKTASDTALLTFPAETETGKITWQFFSMFCLGFILLWALKNLATYINHYCTRWVGTRVVADLRSEIFAKLINQSIRFYGKTDVGQLISRATNDTSAIESSVANVIADATRCPIEILACAAAIVYASVQSGRWSLVLILFIGMPLCILPVAILGRKIRKVYQKSFKQIADVVTRMHEVFSGIMVVKAYHAEKREVERFETANRHYFKTVVRAIRAQLLMSPLMEVVAVASTLAFLVYSYSQEISLAELAQLLAPCVIAYRPIKDLAKIVTYIQRSMAAADRYFQMIDTHTELPEPANPLPFKEFNDKIAFRDVVFGYDSRKILDGVTFDIPKGHIVAVVGETGSGKTTIANLIARFYDCDSGSISIDGKEVRDISVADLRSMIGIVTQDAVLFNDTIADNIAYGMPGATREQVIEAAKQANAHGFIVDGRHPEGYDTIAGEKGFRLSGGEKQRISIARAILKNPPILILDEATSALDTVTEKLVQDALNNVMTNRTVFAIAHRLSTIQNADMIIVLDKGHIVEAGSHEELLALGGRYKKLHDTQFGKEK